MVLKFRRSIVGGGHGRTTSPRTQRGVSLHWKQQAEKHCRYKCLLLNYDDGYDDDCADLDLECSFLCW